MRRLCKASYWVLVAIVEVLLLSFGIEGVLIAVIAGSIFVAVGTGLKGS